MSTTQSSLPKFVAIILCGLLIQSTYKFHQEIQNRIDQQNKVIATKNLWDNQLQAMRPMQATWKKTLPAASALSDQYRITTHIDAPSYQLNLDTHNISISAPTDLKHMGQPIGLLRYAISNNSAQSIRFTTSDFATAWQALIKLQRRPDIRYTRATLENDKGTPTLSLENFSLIARITTTTTEEPSSSTTQNN